MNAPCDPALMWADGAHAPMSPDQYLVQVRVHTERSSLSAGAGQHSLAEVADAVGFADQSHLTHHFKRALGVTPKQSRR
jgi:AraC-like DNA-binding protein